MLKQHSILFLIKNRPIIPNIETGGGIITKTNITTYLGVITDDELILNVIILKKARTIRK